MENNVIIITEYNYIDVFKLIHQRYNDEDIFIEPSYISEFTHTFSNFITVVNNWNFVHNNVPVSLVIKEDRVYVVPLIEIDENNLKLEKLRMETEIENLFKEWTVDFRSPVIPQELLEIAKDKYHNKILVIKSVIGGSGNIIETKALVRISNSGKFTASQQVTTVILKGH